MIKRYFTLLLIVLISIRLSAQVWVVPAENDARKSPFAFDDASRKAGSEIYMTSCKSCHGEPGKNNAVPLVPPPPDMSSVRMQANSDGAMQYKITNGRGTMPSFKNTIATTDVWKVISFVRSFNDKYVQEVAAQAAGGASVANVNIKLNWLKEQNQIQATLSAPSKDEGILPVGGAEVKLFAKRYFGNLLVDEARNTDAAGVALFNFPKDLPGDSAGLVQLVVALSNEAFGDAKRDTTLAIGVPTYRPPLNEQRAMWNVVSKTPIWLLLAYTIAVFGAWGFIIYVFLQIRGIYRAGSEKNTESAE